MKRILFVDDEPNVLQGLQRMLRPQRNVWAMTFCGGGEEALRLMARSCFDILITDMRMPGMSGAQLLEEAQEQFPHVVRIVLSGQADPHSLDALESITHHFLSKPCDAAVLRAAIERIDLPLSGRHPRERLS